MIFFLLTYCLPLTSILVCYIQMGKVLWGNVVIGEENASTQKSRKTKQKVEREGSCPQYGSLILG